MVQSMASGFYWPRLPTGIQKIAKYSNSNFSITRTSNLIMLLKLKSSKHKYLVNTILANIDPVNLK